jgi:oligosaccharyl transferase (archaeosortase A-associated)
MNRTAFKSNLIAGILLAVFFGTALFIRVVLPYDKVFVGDWVKLTGVDAYSIMRLVDNLVHNFPHLITFDPYFLYPSSPGVSIPPFFPYFISGVTWLIGFGSPTQRTVDVVGVYFPAVLGALTTIPVYFIGKTLFNRWAGVIAAGLVAIFPGEFLGRSVLGFTDYHVAEALFTTMTMLFLILAVKAGRDRQLTLGNLWHRQWAAVTKPFIYSILAGVFLGIYFLTWAGALLFVFIIFAYLVIQFIIDHLKNKSTEYLCFVSAIVFIVTFLISLPLHPDRVVLASFAIAIIVPIVMAVLSYFIASRKIKPIIYPAAVVGLGLVSLLFFRILTPSLYNAIVGSFYIFTWPIGTTVLEMQPLLFPGGSFSWALAWGNFTTGFFLSFISLGILVYLVIKRGETEKTAFVVWSLVILAATLAMRRFAYYFVVNVALLTGYLSWLVLDISGFRKSMTKPAERPEERWKKAKPKKREGSLSSGNIILMSLGVLVVLFGVFLPNLGVYPNNTANAINTAKQATFAPSDAWYESLTWLKNNSPDPFGTPDFYYELYQPPAPGKSYQNPQTAYGVTAWWDYGYWITRIGHRIPTSNPGTGNMGEASIFISQDEASANKVMDQFGSRYIIVDHDVAITTLFGGKFYAVATLSGNASDKFYGVYYQVNGNMLEPVLLFYPEYYNSLVVRLYNFDGSKVIPQTSTVISYQEKVTPDGYSYKQITEVRRFDSYEGAHTYISNQKSSNFAIVSPDPYASPVPLPAVEHYRLVYASKDSVTESGKGMVPAVKIFEYSK